MMNKKLRKITAAVILFTGLALWWRSRGSEKLPKYATRTSIVKAAYQYAVENPDLLEQIPCYCNCYRMGHRSVEDCFVKNIKNGGRVIYSDHGANCGICYGIALDAKQMVENGKTPDKIRSIIDEKYAEYGQPTYPK